MSNYSFRTWLYGRLTTMQTPLIFLAVLSVLVLVHEAGHFITAKLLGIKVEEFAFGLPFTKPLLHFRKGETQYAIYPLLFGGFVRMHGEETDVEHDKTRSFWNRGKKQRMLVIVAGVIMNVILAIVGFVTLYAVIGVPQKIVNQVTILQVQPNSPAAQSGLQAEDQVQLVEGKSVTTGEEFSQLMKSWGGVQVHLTVQRGKGVPLFEGVWMTNAHTQVITVTPRVNPPKGEGAIGVGIADYPYLQTQKCTVLSAKCEGLAILSGFKTTGVWAVRILDGLRSIGQSLSHGKAPQGVAGPIGIYQLTDVVAKGGFLPILELTSILSINLAIFNILPIPALDGGRAFFIWLEVVRRKRVSAELEQKINSIGMTILLGLIALITLQDVFHLDFVRHLFGK